MAAAAGLEAPAVRDESQQTVSAYTGSMDTMSTAAQLLLAFILVFGYALYQGYQEIPSVKNKRINEASKAKGRTSTDTYSGWWLWREYGTWQRDGEGGEGGEGGE